MNPADDLNDSQYDGSTRPAIDPHNIPDVHVPISIYNLLNIQEPLIELHMDIINNLIPRAPTRAEIDALVNLTPRSIRPTARRAVTWVRKKLNPFEGTDDDEAGPIAGEDDVQREYEESQRPQRRKTQRGVSAPEMSRVFVPVVKETSDAASRMERMQVPTSMSRMSTPELVGSEFIMETVINICPDKERSVAIELQEAMERDAFKVWPGSVEYGVGDNAKEASAEFQAEKTDEEEERKAELMKTWKERDEKSIEGRERVPGGHEDVVEQMMMDGMFGMVPTLQQDLPGFPARGRPRERTRRAGKKLKGSDGAEDNAADVKRRPDFPPPGRPKRDQRSRQERASTQQQERRDSPLPGRPSQTTAFEWRDRKRGGIGSAMKKLTDAKPSLDDHNGVPRMWIQSRNVHFFPENEFGKGWTQWSKRE